MRRRELGSRVLVGMASLAVLLALVAVYVRIAAVDSDQFANRATAALKDDSVRSLIAARITDDVVLRHQSDLLAARPIIQSVTADIVGHSAFTGLGSLTKAGNGRLVLDPVAVGGNTYDGTTSITAGTLIVRHDQALGSPSAGTSVSSGATLQLEGGLNIVGESLTLAGAGFGTTGNLRNAIHALQDGSGLKCGEGEQQEERSDQLRPDEERQAEPRHAGRAQLDDRRDEIDRAQQ